MQKSRYLYPLVFTALLGLAGCHERGSSAGPEQYLSSGKRVILNSSEGQPLFKIRRKSGYDKVYNEDLRIEGRVWAENGAVIVRPTDGKEVGASWEHEIWSLGESVRVEPMEDAWLVYGAQNKLVGYLGQNGDSWDFRKEWGGAPSLVATRVDGGTVVRKSDRVVARSLRMTPLEAICALLTDLGPLERVALWKALELV